MKKYIVTALSIIFIVFLSGCSLKNPISTGGASNSGSIWKSIDGGKTWEIKNKTGEKTILPAVDVLSIAISPTNSNKVLFGTRENGIILTKDGGENLETTNFTSGKVYGLEINPGDENIVYASGVWQGRGKIFKSLDFGQNWKEIYTSAADGPLVVSIAIDTNNSKIIYASTSDNQIIKTTDAGETWKNVFTGQSPVIRVAIDRNNSNLIYFITTGAIERSKNGGADFEDISKAALDKETGNRDFSLIAADPYNGNWVYAAGGMGILRSKNSGDTWEKVNILNNPQNFPVKAVSINPANSREIIYGASQAVYKSTDEGANWSTFQLESSKSIKALRYSTVDPSIIYLGLSK